MFHRRGPVLQHVQPSFQFPFRVFDLVDLRIGQFISILTFVFGLIVRSLLIRLARGVSGRGRLDRHTRRLLSHSLLQRRPQQHHVKVVVDVERGTWVRAVAHQQEDVLQRRDRDTILDHIEVF